MLAACVLASAGLVGSETRLHGAEAQIEPTYDGRTLDEWKQLSVNDLSTETRVKAMQAFAAFGQAGRSEKAIGAIKSALDQLQENEAIKAAYNALIRLGPPALPLLLDGLKSERAETRQIVVKELRSYAPSKDPSKRVVPEAVVLAILQAAEDPDPSVRGTACGSLGALVARGAGEKYAHRMIPVLVKALQDEAATDANGARFSASSVQIEACRALARFGAKAEPAVPALLELAQREPMPDKSSPDWGRLLATQHVAIQALGAIGPPAKAAIPVLETLMRKPPYSSPSVRRAIEKIRGRSRGPYSSKQPQGPAAPGQLR